MVKPKNDSSSQHLAKPIPKDTRRVSDAHKAAAKASRRAPARVRKCRICKIGKHTPLTCMKVEAGTGMVAVCPLHPNLANHTMDECLHLDSVFANTAQTKDFFHILTSMRQGLPPIKTSIIDINEWAKHLNHPLDQMPWSVSWSKLQWHVHSDYLSRKLDYDLLPDLPATFQETNRTLMTRPQTLHQKPVEIDWDTYTMLQRYIITRRCQSIRAGKGLGDKSQEDIEMGNTGTEPLVTQPDTSTKDPNPPPTAGTPGFDPNQKIGDLGCGLVPQSGKTSGSKPGDRKLWSAAANASSDRPPIASEAAASTLSMFGFGLAGQTFNAGGGGTGSNPNPSHDSSQTTGNQPPQN
ncbi:hypothetical protein PG984_008146 [Apiospora sp. TS-2023a]